ncbi:heme-binding protein 1-like [Penaeus japonicus]|uniref:heme-binding protein 1-like n=1 Tax=Penaeus japonicus TaxID=27405 RepID=UPI001C70F902|nr:heme-binding protein 1-like [Penaeus japonicus]
MRYLILLTVLLAATSTRADFFDNISSQISSFFRSYEEPIYNTTHLYPGYQERVYAPSKWVCTEHTAHSDDDDVTEVMFWKLFRYISGDNDRSEKIDMTIPVTTEFTKGGATNQYEMCFYIGLEHQSNPAIPTDAQVTIQERPQLTVLTRTIGGYVEDDEEWLEEASRLAEIIKANNGETVSLSHMYWVGYDAPFKFWNRRNEVWFIKN